MQFLPVTVYDGAPQQGETFVSSPVHITVTMEGYRLIDGCQAIARESPKCCTAIPCPVCSLFACLLAEGTGSVVEVERCTAHPGKGSVDAVFVLLL